MNLKIIARSVKPDYDPGEKTFGMAKWRASQKARRKQGNLKLESQAESKPYHFDDPGKSKSDFNRLPPNPAKTLFLDSSKIMDPPTTVSYPVSPTTDSNTR